MLHWLHEPGKSAASKPAIARAATSWAAVTPDLDPTLLTVKRGDKVFANALGKMSSQEYSTALGTAIRGLTDSYVKSAPPAT